MHLDFALRNAKIQLQDGTIIENVEIGVKDEKIVAITKVPNLPKADEEVDVRNQLVLPGAIDVHTHILLKTPFPEDFRTGTLSAAAGGVTTVIDMPTVVPNTMTSNVFIDKRTKAAQEAIVDFGLHAGEVQKPNDLDEIKGLAKMGATAFKISMAGYTMASHGVMLDALKILNEINRPAIVHAEDGDIVSYLQEVLQRKREKTLLAYAESRPPVAEEVAIRTAIALARYTNARLHIAHVTCREAVKAISDSKNSSLGTLTAETCPQYLLLSEKDFDRLGSLGKVTPPIRSKEDSSELWTALQFGTLDIVATDHCPYLRQSKEAIPEDIWKSAAGFPGIETLIPLMLSEGVNKKRISLRRFVQMTSENPARIFGLYPMKGSINIGSDADLMVVDLAKKMKIQSARLHTACDYTPFEDWEVEGLPTMTIVRGKIVMRDGNVIGKPGYGRFLTPKRTSERIFDKSCLK